MENFFNCNSSSWRKSVEFEWSDFEALKTYSSVGRAKD